MNKLRVIHIIMDCPQALGIFNFWQNIDVYNEYILEIDPNDSEIKVVDADSVIALLHDNLQEYLATKDYDVVLFHGLHPYRYSLVNSIPEDRVIMRSTWGYDLYYPEGKYPAVVPIKLFKPITHRWKIKLRGMTILYKLYKHNKDLHWNFWQGTQNWYQECFGSNEEQIVCQQKALTRVDYIATVLGDFEYDKVRKNTCIQAKYFIYKYFGTTKIPANQPIDYSKLIDVSNAKYILLGNSGDPSNNHADVIHILRNRGIKMPLYMPMAYANERHYDAFIKKVVATYNSDSVIQSTIFPYDEYKRLTSSCKVGIYGHLRQQAIGNISMCFTQGIKVFLYKEGVPYKYYKSRGFIVFSIEDDLNQKAIDTPLTYEEITHNIKLLRSTSYDDVIKSVNETMKEVAIKRQEKLALC